MVKHCVLTLTGAAQRLSDALADNDKLPSPDGPMVRALTLQPGGGNAGVIYCGGLVPTITSSDYGFRLEAAAAGVPPAPFVWELGDKSVRLGDIRVLGSNTEKLHISYAE